MKTLITLFLSLAAAALVQAQAPPATVSKTLTSGSTSLTVEFVLHPIRSANFNVQVQDATGNFTPYTADVPRTYIGTVTGRPGAIAAGFQKANGTFWSYIIFEDGTTWSSSGTSATAGGTASWTPNIYPTTGVGAGGAGSIVYAAELGIDASYREWQAVGSNLASAVDMIEFCAMKANIIYLRDAAILHRIGRIVIRTDAAKCPYQALPSATTSDWSVLLNTMKTQWNTVLPPVLGASAHDVASLVRPGVGGGLASVGVIGTSSRYSITGATSSGDFVSAWRHELGHNWSSSHYEGGGKPEGPTVMSDNSVSRFSSSELAKIINHRNSKTSVLDNLGSYTSPLPPRVFGDRVTMSAGSIATVTDVLANDSDSNGQPLVLHSSDSASSKRALIVRSPGTGPSGRDQLIYYAPPGYTSGYDYYNYRIEDSAGYQGIGKVYVNPVKLPALPPLWASSDIGAVGATGDAGVEGGTYVVYGGGADVWGTADEFRFVRQAANGDCDIRARVTGQANTNGYAKAGVMLRDGIGAGAAHASIFVTPANGFAFQYRAANGGSSTNLNGPALNPGINNWVRLTRAGSLITSYVSADGVSWTSVGSTTIPMAATIQAGLAVTSHVDASVGGAAFDRVSLSHGEPYAELVKDTFEGGSAANDASESLDVGWNGVTLTTASDATLGTGLALNVDGSTYAGLDTTFAGRALQNTGDVLKLSFNFRYTQNPGNLAAGFRFGLFNSTGDGYSVQNGTGGNTAYSIVKDAGSDNSFGFGSLTTLTSSTKATLNDQNKHTASLMLRKTEAGIAVTATVDGVSITGIDATPPTSSFEMLNISNGNITGDYRIDNVRVEAFQLVAPAFNSDPFSKTTAAIGLAYGGSLVDDVNVPHPGHSYAKTSGPAWLTVAANGTLSGTPAAGDAGTNSFGVQVTSETGAVATAAMNIAVAYPVTVTATDSSASEDDLSGGIITLTRTGPTTVALTVNYTVGGTATAGSDYVSIGTSAVIPIGQSSVAIPVTPLDDALLEPSETIVLTLLPSSDYAPGTVTSATVTLSDDESLFVRMNDGFDSPTSTPGNDADDPFDSAWTGSGATLSVASDTTFNTGKALNVDATATYGGAKGAFSSRSLPANGDSITLSFDFRYTAAPTNVSAGLRFGLYNSTGAGFCVHHGTGGNTGLGLLECPDGTFGSGTLTGITSGTKATLNDQVKHTMVLNLRKTASGIVVTSTVDGVSHTGTDATPVITTFDTVLISNGNQTIDFRIDNARVEFSPNLAPAFTVNPLVKSAVIDAAFSASLADDATDANPGDTFTFAKTAGPSWLTVAANGAASGTPSVANIGANPFTIRLMDNYGATADMTLTVNVGYPLTVAATHPWARELGEVPGTFTVTRSGPTTNPLTVSYTYGGTATAGDDFDATVNSAVIPAGQVSVDVPLTPVDDADFEDDETVILKLAPDAAYAVGTPGSATLVISDNETDLHRVEDTFDIGAVPTTGNDGDDPSDAAWTSSGGTIALVEDGVMDSGKALQLTATGTFSMVRANFTAVPLSQPGDKLKLNLQVRYTEALPNVASGFRFGLFNGSGDGFFLQHGIGGATGWALAEDTGADNGFGSGGTTTGLFSGTKPTLNDQLKHEFSLTLTKTATGIQLGGEGDGSVITFTDTTPVITSFDALAIRHGNHTTDFAIDNVTVEIIRNRTPFFTTNPVVKAEAIAGSAYGGTLEDDAADPNEGDVLTFSKVAGPAWLGVAADGTLSGTPASGDAGDNSFTVRVEDPYGSASESTMLIEVTEALSPIESWRFISFGEESSNPAIAGDNADPDGDGLANLIEYALGMDPNGFSPAPVVDVEEGNVSITYTRDLGANDVTVTPQWSDTLGSWHDTGFTTETISEANGIRTLKATIATGANAKFLRVKVE